MIADIKNVSLSGPGRDVWTLHGQSDAVGRDEGEDDEVEPSLRGEVSTLHPQVRVGWEEIERVSLPLGQELSELLTESFVVVRGNIVNIS